MSRHRTQVLFEGERHDRLAEMANAQGKSVSAVVRELVDQGLEISSHRESRSEALDRLAALGERIEQRGGVPSEDLLEEVRGERERQRDEVLFGGCGG